MSIGQAFSSALSGLRVTGRATEVIAENISNATTPGFGRRTLEQSSTSGNFVGGATIVGITREVDPSLLAARRNAQAEFGYADDVSVFLNRLETSIGTPDNPRALTNLFADFDTALLAAASRPDANERLQAVVNEATNIVDAIQRVSAEISLARTEADQNINSQVDRLNAALEEVEYLNSQISRALIGGRDPFSIADLRQGVIDEINEIVPVRTVERDNGSIGLYTTAGLILLDGPAREVEFSPTNTVTPYMSLAGGQLSGLTIGGFDVHLSSATSKLPGGTLAAQFVIRDDLATDAMAQIDAAARDLVERFQDPSVDTTLTTGDPGIFTDGTGSFDPVNEIGLSERIGLNSMIDPSQGGDLWRVRDGLNATQPGPAGQAALINSLSDAINDQRSPASGDFGTGTMSASGLANSMISRVGVQRLSAEQSLAFTSAAFFAASQAEREDGVDTDTELQQMLVMEKAYSANARMLQTIDEMMETLLRI